MTVPSKKQLTKLFLEHAAIPITTESFNLHLLNWWVSPFGDKGLRLTKDGADFLTNTLQLQKYPYLLKDPFEDRLKIIWLMNKYLESPFYLKDRNTIIFFGEQDAIMMSMMSGDLTQYLLNFER